MWTHQPEAPRFLRDDRGSLSIEFVLWLPVFVAFLVITSDTSFAFMTHTRMWNAARECTRNIAVGATPASTAAAENCASALLPGNVQNWAINYSEQSLGGVDTVTVSIRTTGGDAMIFGGLFEEFTGADLVASVTMRKETI
ncbi:MAG: TadE/TadG family type IV pilus assembly protein [Pseudomonadota bacterium]